MAELLCLNLTISGHIIHIYFFLIEGLFMNIYNNGASDLDKDIGLELLVA